ncbi:hypothetical protein [Priestia endophytica]|uniref:hypothetical protein n=1 Tax=Priestia endophytica TaxID=135735 RepID=UPI000DCA7B7C|nr:hypothetical protein [Priestia endophytica]RAS76201.1 hypothetical protein A4R27_21470 [Priestia endophytica]
MKKSKGIILGLIVLFLISAILFFLKDYIFTSNDQPSSKESKFKMGDMEQNALGLAGFKANGEPLYDAQPIKLDENQTANFELALAHMLDTDETYGIILMQDYIQSEFTCGDKVTADICKQSIPPSTEVSIPLSIKINPDTRELIVLIVKEPDSIVKDMDLNQLFYYEQAYAKRYIIDGSVEKDDVVYIDPDSTYKSPGDTNAITFSGDKTERQLVSSMFSGEKGYLHMGTSIGNQEMDYAVVAFNDWKQTKINDDTIMHINTKPDVTYVYDVSLPLIKKEANLQFFAFPTPYTSDSSDSVFKVYQSTRTVVESYTN